LTFHNRIVNLLYLDNMINEIKLGKRFEYLLILQSS